MTAEKSVLRQDEIFLRRAFHKSLFPCILSILSQNLNIWQMVFWLASESAPMASLPSVYVSRYI